MLNGQQMFAAIASVSALAILSVPHCAAMCGPLASCASKGSSRSALRYQLGRLIGYGTIGGFAGALGSVLFAGIATWVSAAVAWFAAVVLLVAAIRSWRSKARNSHPVLLQLQQPSRNTRSRSASSRLIALGARLLRQHPGTCGGMTALLPCGVLWAAVVIALSSGSILGGVVTMVVFAALTAVSITVASIAIGQLRSRLGAKPMAIVLALSAVFFIVLPLPQLAAKNTQPSDRAGALCPLHTAAASLTLAPFTLEKAREPTSR